MALRVPSNTAGEWYPLASTARKSTIRHDKRSATWGIVIHWTAGYEPGDLNTLDGPSVDVQFYVAKDGDTYQLLPASSEAWHGYSTANNYTIGIETEGFGEPWTDKQLDAVATLTSWLSKKYGIPIKHVDPSAGNPASFHGIFGHRDLSIGGLRVDGNNHTDSVPDGTGWGRFLNLVRSKSRPATVTRYYYEDLYLKPEELGPWKLEPTRDAVYLAQKALGRVVTKARVDGGYGIRRYKRGTYGMDYASKPFDVKAERDAQMKANEKLTGRRMRPYSITEEVAA